MATKNGNGKKLREGYKTAAKKLELQENVEWPAEGKEAVYVGQRDPIEWTDKRTGDVKTINVYQFTSEGEDYELVGNGGLDFRMKAVVPGCKIVIEYKGKIKLPNGNPMNEYEVQWAPTPASNAFLKDKQAAKFTAEAQRATASA